MSRSPPDQRIDSFIHLPLYCLSECEIRPVPQTVPFSSSAVPGWSGPPSLLTRRRREAVASVSLSALGVETGFPRLGGPPLCHVAFIIRFLFFLLSFQSFSTHSLLLCSVPSNNPSFFSRRWNPARGKVCRPTGSFFYWLGTSMK